MEQLENSKSWFSFFSNFNIGAWNKWKSNKMFI